MGESSWVHTYHTHDVGEIAARWCVWSVEGIGPKRMGRIVSATDGEVASLWDDRAWRARLESVGLSDKITARLEQVLGGDPRACYEGESEALGPQGALLYVGEGRYPSGLRDLEDAPTFLCVRGATSALWMPSRVALVGSRQPSVAQAAQARELSRALAARGATIVSGGALGMDAAAHSGALSARGTTLALLPGGVSRLTPMRHERLFERIVQEGGALVTEYPREVSARRYHFARRNRLIAALSHGVLVLRAGSRGGTMLTAQAASALGRPLAALPYEAGDEGARGSLELIRSGRAQLVVTEAHVWSACLGHSCVEPPVVRGREESPRDHAPQAPDLPQHDVFGWAIEAIASIDQEARGAGRDRWFEFARLRAALPSRSSAQISAALATLEIEGWLEKALGAARWRVARSIAGHERARC